MDEITQILRKCFNPNSLSLSSLHTQNLYVEGNCCRFRLMNHKISFTRTRARMLNLLIATFSQHRCL